MTDRTDTDPQHTLSSQEPILLFQDNTGPNLPAQTPNFRFQKTQQSNKIKIATLSILTNLFDVFFGEAKRG
jgi:hypothetical protein